MAKKRAKKAKRAKKTKADKSASGRSTEKAGVGTAKAPENKRIPEDVLIPRVHVSESGTKVTRSAEVQGNKSLQIIDILNSRPVSVSIIEGRALTPDADGTLVFVQGAVGNDWLTAEGAKARFAEKPDGTVIYNARGFDDVPATVGEFELVDIVKLVDYNHGKKRKK